MKITQITPHILATLAILAPAVVFAHCDATNSDGGCGAATNPDGSHAAGASALLKAFSLQWWGLLLVAALITTLLSYGVWKFLRVTSVKKPEVKK